MPPVHSEVKRKELAEYQVRYRQERFAVYTCNRLKGKAARLGLAFDLVPEDIVVPKFCPVLGIELTVAASGQHDSAASVDRIIPAKGYVKGNIRIISMKANRIKNDATIEELQLVLEDLRRLHGHCK